jgi:hypothetical protein
LNLVDSRDKHVLFSEIFRVLRVGGRAVISDIVSDETVPLALQQDPTLWSGCISGALREDHFLAAFEGAGFHGIRILKRDRDPWQAVEGIEFRSMTVEAFKGENGDWRDLNQAVVYRGPFREVTDDDGTRMRRGERLAVSDKSFRRYGQEPYTGLFDLIEPRDAVDPERAAPFDRESPRRRLPSETKGTDFRITTQPGTCCDGGVR